MLLCSGKQCLSFSEDLREISFGLLTGTPFLVHDQTLQSAVLSPRDGGISGDPKGSLPSLWFPTLFIPFGQYLAHSRHTFILCGMKETCIASAFRIASLCFGYCYSPHPARVSREEKYHQQRPLPLTSPSKAEVLSEDCPPKPCGEFCQDTDNAWVSAAEVRA